LLYLAELLLKWEVSKLVSSLVNLVVVAPIAFVLFPRWLGIPFGRIETRAYLKRVGLYLPAGAWKHVALGLLLAICTLSAMLVASILTGKYAFDSDTISLSQLVFSLNPGLWEELFYRGVLMILLLQITRSLKLAFVIQIILFGAMHIKGLDLWDVVDVLSVMVLAWGYTFAAYKTRLLVAGIVWHYFHDAFLYTVQLPDGVYTGVAENVTFYGILWLMVGVACIAIKLAADRFGVRAPQALYLLDGPAAGQPGQ
jgi:membrane protease YdiL (CAAX protease family)